MAASFDKTNESKNAIFKTECYIVSEPQKKFEIKVLDIAAISIKSSLLINYCASHCG